MIQHVLTLEPSLQDNARVRAFLGRVAEEAGFSTERTFDIQVAVSEAMANAIEHAHGAGEVRVELSVFVDRLEVSVQGAGEFHLPAPSDGREHRGLGLPLMATLSDHLALYSRPHGGTLVSLTFYLPGSHRSESSLPPSLVELLAEHSLLEDVLAHVSDSLMVFDEEWRLVYVNDQAAERLGRPREELLGEVVGAFRPEFAERTAFGEWHRAAREQRRVTAEDYDPPLDRWFEDRAFPFAGGLAVFSRDITKRKRAELELRQSEERFRTMADAIPQLAWIADADGYIYWYNQRWYEYTGTTLSEMEGWGWQSVHDPEALPQVLERWKSSIATGRPFDMEFPLRGADGAFRPFLTRVMPLKDAAGAVMQWFGTNTDLTERKRAEEALRASQERARRQLETILSPNGDLGLLELGDIIDVPAVQSLMDHFYALAHIPMAVIDRQGKVLVGEGWQDICTKFHRVHPETCAHCLESDTQLSAGVPFGEYRLYKCKNGMWDIATPIVVAGEHLGNVFSGQFFFADEDLDYALFRTQARRYGFDEQMYMDALEAAPRLTRSAVQTGVQFLVELATMLSQLGYSNLKLARSEREGERLLGEVQKAAEKLHAQNEELAVQAGELRVQTEEAAKLLDERERREAELLRLNRTLHALGNSKQALTQATDETRYLHEVCRIVAEDCGHAMVWIGYAEADEAKTVRPVTHWGFDKGYLETLRVTWADCERGRGPTGTAIRTGKASGCRDMLTDPRFTPWREEAIKRGYGSSLALPLLENGKAMGAVTIYSSSPDAFSEAEVNLLTELAADLAYGIAAVRLRAAHARAQEEREQLLAVAETELRRSKVLNEVATACASSFDLR